MRCAIFDAVFPLLILGGLGYFAARGGFFRQGEIDGLARFVFHLAIPAMLFHSLATRSLPADTDGSLLLAFYLPTFLLFGLVMVVSRLLFGYSLTEQGIFALGATFSNTLYIGMPVFYSLLGPDSMLPLFLIISIQSGTLFFLVSLVAGFDSEAEKAGLLASLGRAGGAIARDPIVVSLIAGLAVSLLGWALPVQIANVTELLGQAGLPCALFVLGANLQRYRIGGELAPILLLSTLKNLIHPALVWLTLHYFFSFDPLWTQVAVLTAALPSGINTYLLAEKYDVQQEVIASNVLLSTVIGIATLSFWLWLLAA